MRDVFRVERQGQQPAHVAPIAGGARAGVPIITFNPLRERGLESFTNPQSPVEMLTLSETEISTQYHQLQPGVICVLVGMSKALLAMDDEAKAAGTGRVDRCRLHRAGHERLPRLRSEYGPPPMVGHRSVPGLIVREIEAAARFYRNAKAVIICYGMGLTQHR